MTFAIHGGGDAHPPRVAIVDLDRRVQQSVADVLRVAGLEVVGTAGDVRSALELIEATRPEVVIIDPRLPEVSAGSALLSSIGLAWPTMRVVLMGWADGAEPALADRRTFVSKSAQPEEFVAAALAACTC
ncbi:MAG TPA: response regulator [Candidatus Limnocylindria bacterium]